MEKIFQIAKNIFGVENFYDLQLEIIKSILDRKNTIAIMPTGGGKSLCYQIPAIMFEGSTIVVSPIISLMKDQVENLKNRYHIINVDYLASTKDKREILHILNNIKYYKILYVTPERLLSKDFMSSLKGIRISMLVIDEAHCISLWGNSFRSSYQQIGSFIRKFKIDVVSCFTATANKKIIEDIKFYLGLKSATIFKKSIYRDNLTIKIKLTDEKKEELLNLIDNKTSILFVSSKLTLNRISNFLKFKGVDHSIYHADLLPHEKDMNQKKFIGGKSKLMLATSAFGMGIDKKDIRKIIHLELPYEIEEYFQEIGRAGRDGELSECILLVSFDDIENYEKMLSKKYLSYNFLKLKLKNYIKKIFKYDLKVVFSEIIKLLRVYYFNRRKMLVEKEKFNIMKSFIFNDGCRFDFLLEYFLDEKKNCNKCDKCKTTIGEVDFIGKHILALLNKNFWIDFKTLIEILQGKSLKYIVFPGYGKLRGVSPESIKKSIYNLFNQNLIKIKILKNNFYFKAKI